MNKDDVVVQPVKIVAGLNVTVPFHGTVDPNSEKTLVSQKLDFTYKTKLFRVSFPLNVNRTVRIRFFISSDKEVGTAVERLGDNPLLPYGAVSYVVGDDEIKDLPHEMKVLTAPTWLKVFAENLDAWPHTVDAEIFIERLEVRD